MKANNTHTTPLADTYYFSWVRKGLGNAIEEKDQYVTEAMESDVALALERAQLYIETHYETTSAEQPQEEGKSAVTHLSADKMVQFVGPGDVTGLNPAAIKKCSPQPHGHGFPVQCFPYIEFWEPDFPWRYTPACPNDDRLRPWLALIVAEAETVQIEHPQKGLPYVTFQGDEEAFRRLLPEPGHLWQCAHAQGDEPGVPLLSRLLALRDEREADGRAQQLKADTAYVAMLVPTFEVGRLQGLGCDKESLAHVVAQMPAWEASLAEQQQRHPVRPLEFPIYHSWTFTSGSDTFDTLAHDLTVCQTAKGGIKVDVTRMGEGLDYAVLFPEMDDLSTDKPRTLIDMPAATQCTDDEPQTPFPNPKDKKEKLLYENLSNLLKKSPVFAENAALRQGQQEGEPVGDDDPWVTPPIYGARHVLATSFEDKDLEWLSQINLDVHYRAVAGLGKTVVQKHQEELVNRAWKQIEGVQALNNELYQRLASINTNKSLQYKVLPDVDATNEKYIANMMQYLNTMRQASAGKEGQGTTLSDVLSQRGIPEAFATATFQRMTDELTRHVSQLDSTSVMENIVAKQSFKMSEHHVHNQPNAETLLSRTTDKVFFETFRGELNRLLGRPITNATFDVFAGTGSRYQVTAMMAGTLQPIWQGELTASLLKRPQAFMTFNSKETAMHQWFNLAIDQYDAHDVLTPYRMIADFLGSEHSRHAWYGYFFPSGTTRPGQINMLAVDDEYYAAMFGKEKLVTRIEVNGAPFYFVAKSYLEARKGQPTAVLYWVRAPKASCVKDRQVYNGNTRKMEIRKEELTCTLDACVNDPTNGRYYNLRTGESSPTLVQYYSNFDYIISHNLKWKPAALADYRKADSLFNHEATAEQRAEYTQNEERMRAYVYDTPDYVDVFSDQVSSDDMQLFAQMGDYMYYLHDHEELTGLGKIKLLRELTQLCRELTAESATTHTGDGQADEDVKAIRVAMEDQEAEARMMAVAQSYYSEFWADTEAGRKLREDYLDDLLRSKYPIMAYPLFPEPTYYYLRMISDKFIIPSIDEMPDDSVAMFLSNAPFEEAFLAGMNTEMGQELLWREYPTDRRGSYFRKFWDAEVSADDIRANNFFDIQSLHTWSGSLGSNHQQGKTGLLIFAIKGRLLKSYPGTRVYLHRATLATSTEGQRDVEFDLTATVGDGIMMPVMEASLRDDTLLVGFTTTLEQAVGNPKQKDYGYFLAFAEEVEDITFQTEPEAAATEPGQAAQVAARYYNQPTTYGKHLSLFVCKPQQS